MKGGPSAGPPFAFDQGSDFQVCAGVALPVPRPTKKTPCPNNKSFPVGGKDSVKENRQGCLSHSIRAGAIKSAKRDALPVSRPTKKTPEGVFFVGADVLNQPKFHT